MKLYTGSFSQIGSRAYQVRDIVFVKEQNVPVEHEHDDKDEISEHFLIEHNGEAVATARVQPDGHIGRFAVVKRWRGKGLGLGLLNAIIATCKDRGMEHLFLNAQEHALDFYKKCGFKIKSDPFVEAGIVHRRMELDCKDVKIPEMVYVVDENNDIQSITTRAIMREKRLGHRASYIAVCNRDNKFLIELRTLSKDYAPGLFDACVGGIEQIFEDRFDSALRELEEEVGIKADRQSLHYLGFEKIDSPPTYVLADMYFIKGDFITKRQSSEVSGIMYLDLEDIKSLEKNFAKDSYKAFFKIVEKAQAAGLIK